MIKANTISRFEFKFAFAVDKFDQTEIMYNNEKGTKYNLIFRQIRSCTTSQFL